MPEDESPLKPFLGRAIEDHPPWFCAVPGCRERYDSLIRTDFQPDAMAVVRRIGLTVYEYAGKWIADVPLCAHHGYRRWYPSFTPDGELQFREFGPPPRSS